VTLQTFDKRVSVGDLLSFDVKIDGVRGYCPVRFVVCANVSHDCLLSLADYRGLLAVADKPGTDERQDKSTFGVANVDNDPGANSEFAPDSVVGCGDNEGNDGEIAVGELTGFNNLVDPNSSQVGELIAEQSRDKSLTGAFALACDNKGGYFLRDGLLFHRAQIQGRDVDSLVVLMGRRSALLDLAHAQVGCHSGIGKTKQRIGLSFTWPTLVKNVVKFCRCCHVCQKQARVTFRDRRPIQAGVVSTEPVFSHFYIDCLGPLFNTKTQYNYALVFLDKPHVFHMLFHLVV